VGPVHVLEKVTLKGLSLKSKWRKTYPKRNLRFEQKHSTRRKRLALNRSKNTNFHCDSKKELYKLSQTITWTRLDTVANLGALCRATGHPNRKPPKNPNKSNTNGWLDVVRFFGSLFSPRTLCAGRLPEVEGELKWLRTVFLIDFEGSVKR